ncbi:MAG: hypothetical protein D6679_14320, partial [Candidatus Hydrogenedentota bacterium]
MKPYQAAEVGAESGLVKTRKEIFDRPSRPFFLSDASFMVFPLMFSFLFSLLLVMPFFRLFSLLSVLFLPLLQFVPALVSKGPLEMSPRAPTASAFPTSFFSSPPAMEPAITSTEPPPPSERAPSALAALFTRHAPESPPPPKLP